MALDESTKREIEQIGLIMELKMAQVEEKETQDSECEACQAYENENKLLHEQNE